MSNSKYKFEFSEGTLREERIYKIFKKNNNPKTMEMIHWQYSKSPCGEAISAFAIDENNEVAAVYSVFKVKFRIDNTVCVVAQSLDTMTDKKHIGRSLFTRLAKLVYEECCKQSVEFVYGFPNCMSGPIFLKRLKWKKVSNPPFLVSFNNILFPIKWKYNKDIRMNNFLLSSYLSVAYLNKKFIIKTLDKINKSDYVDFWMKLSPDIKTALEKNIDYMLWRYQKKPRVEYNYRCLYYLGSLISIIVFRIVNKHQGKIGYIMEFLFLSEFHSEASIFFKKISKEIHKLNVDMVLAWNIEESGSRRIYYKSGFFPLPRRFQPIKLFFGYIKLKDSLSENITIELSYSDSDTV